MSKGNFSAVWVLHRQGMEGRVGGGGGSSSTAAGCEKNTQAHTQAIQINFKAEVEEISVPMSPRFLAWKRTSTKKWRGKK